MSKFFLKRLMKNDWLNLLINQFCNKSESGTISVFIVLDGFILIINSLVK